MVIDKIVWARVEIRGDSKRSLDRTLFQVSLSFDTALRELRLDDTVYKQVELLEITPKSAEFRMLTVSEAPRKGKRKPAVDLLRIQCFF
jgi:hypothetical protein